MPSRDEISQGLIDELGRFADLVRGLDDDQWQRPTRCAGWTVADVAGHLAGSMTDVVAGRLDGLGTPEVTAREAEERRGRTPAEVADELAGSAKASADLLAMFDDAAWAAPAPAGFDGTLAEGVEALWYDAYLHGDDIRAAVGMPSVDGPGLSCSLRHVALMLDQQAWGPATIALDGAEPLAVNGGGKRITGDPLAFVKVATGRGDPAAFGLDTTVNIYRA
jgi:uncharacterized protein (TIGR03083 family)